MRTAVALVAVLIAGCTAPGSDAPPIDDGPVEPVFPAYGVALSPRDFGDHFAGFFAEAAQAGNTLAWGGPPEGLGTDGAGTVTALLGSQEGLQIFIQTGNARQEDGHEFEDVSDPAARMRLLAEIERFVSDHPIAFFVFGVEVNFLRENGAGAYDRLVDFYPHVYDTVKTASPGTLVFPTFQYERMRGDHGGLFGGQEGQPTQWDVLDDFPQRDLTAFTVYPVLTHADPSDIPDDYLDDAVAHLGGRPLAITETGWHSHDVAPGWESDAAEQAAFVERLFGILPDHAMVLWPFLYDQPAPEVFTTMGLKDAETGDARPAWDAWGARAR